MAIWVRNASNNTAAHFVTTERSLLSTVNPTHGYIAWLVE